MTAMLRWSADGDRAHVEDGDGAVLATYDFARRHNQPHLHPVRHLGGGGPLTNHAPWDHPWHHGLWWAFKLVDGFKAWEDRMEFGGPARGLARTVAVATEARGARLRQRLELRVADRRETLLRELRLLTLREAPGIAAGWELDWDLQWRAERDLELAVTPYPEKPHGGYMGLAYRPARSMEAGEAFAGSGGRDRPEQLHGEPCDWLAYAGNVDGAEHGRPDAPPRGGMAILDHPANRRRASGFALSASGPFGFGKLAASALFHEPLRLGAGEQLALRYRTIAFAGDPDPAALDAAWRAFAGEAPPRQES